MKITSKIDSHTATDVKLEMIPGIQTGNGIPPDKYDKQKKQHFHAKMTVH